MCSYACVYTKRVGSVYMYTYALGRGGGLRRIAHSHAITRTLAIVRILDTEKQ